MSLLLGMSGFVRAFNAHIFSFDMYTHTWVAGSNQAWMSLHENVVLKTRVCSFSVSFSCLVCTAVRLFRSPDRVKDQTYFLSRLRQDQLARADFPIGRYTKPQVHVITHPSESYKSQGQRSRVPFTSTEPKAVGCDPKMP